MAQLCIDPFPSIRFPWHWRVNTKRGGQICLCSDMNAMYPWKDQVRCISCWHLMNFHDCCNCTAFLDLKKHHVIAVSVVAVSVMKSAREVCNVMPLTYHFLFGPFMESLLQHVDVTYVNTLADQYRPSLTSNITKYHENLMLRSGLFGRWWTNKRESIISMRFVFLLQQMAKSWDERHLLRESGSFHENSHHVRTFQSLFLFG